VKRFEVDSGYRQFYVADSVIEPLAPEKWNDIHVTQRHNTLENIVALCPVGDITARIISIGPEEEFPAFDDQPEFTVETSIEVPNGKVGIYGWPWEKQYEYEVSPGTVLVRFSGYALDRVEQEEDYYLVQLVVE
jgi:hypothetical protein